MKSRIVPVKNIARLTAAADVLIHRSPGMPGMGLVHGETGYGKTTAVTWLINRVHGVYVRAMATWTPSAMLGALLREVDRAPRGSCAQMQQDLIDALADSGRPVFVDEADYLVDQKRLCETLRDLHDMATVPVILIGMGGIDQRLAHRKQLTGRVLEDVRFEPADAADARLLADGLCEIKVRDDLLDRLVRVSRGSVRLLVVGLSRVEQRAKARGLIEMGAADWGAKEDFFTGDAPLQSSGKVSAIGAR